MNGAVEEKDKLLSQDFGVNEVASGVSGPGA